MGYFFGDRLKFHNWVFKEIWEFHSNLIFFIKLECISHLKFEFRILNSTCSLPANVIRNYTRNLHIVIFIDHLESILSSFDQFQVQSSLTLHGKLNLWIFLPFTISRSNNQLRCIELKIILNCEWKNVQPSFLVRLQSI